ncbi:MAG: SDR family NAD(P)-dependent oxidoreductase [Herpetosiphonaceae bacterium]|nr:SDR family NAD(P)-dependent oxidoreductase [Herpetosiphonaceae bacterium]
MSKPVCTIVGAGPGISLAVAERFAREGFQIALIARRAAALDEYVRQLGGSATAHGFVADAGDEQALIGAFDAIHQLGPTAVLVYNASAGHAGSPLTLAAADLIADFKVSVVGALVATQQVVPHMQASGRGTILLTGGGLALNPYPAYAALAVGKAGIRNLSFSLAAELAPARIHVATITIDGFVQPNTPLAPDVIAEGYWRLHTQPRNQWEREIVYRAAA